MNDVGFPLLTAIVVLPAVGALGVALLPRSRPEIVRLTSILVATATGALTIYLLVRFQVAEPGFQFTTQHTWVEAIGTSWHLGVDGISLFLVVLTGVLFPLALVGVREDHDQKAYAAWMLLLMAGCLGVFLALDLLLFFVFFEVVLVPMYFIIGIWGHGERVYAAVKFFLYTMFGSAFLLVGILVLVVLHASATGVTTFDVVVLAESQSWSAEAGRWLFAAFAIAFAIKVPLFPVHTWLPDAHTNAPTAGSVILAGVLLKMGTYGFFRFGLYLFPEAAQWFAPALLTLGVIGITYGAIVATMQRDLKRLVAYSSVAHLGFIVLGTFALTSEAMTGSVAQMINHGITTGALFLLVGWIYERRHTRRIGELQGLAKAAPIMAAVFLVAMLASIGVPGLNGFVGEFLILIGTFASHRWWAVAAAVGVILAAVYLLWAYQRTFQGVPEGDNATMRDLRLREGLVIAPFVAAMVFLGLFPQPLLERIEPAVDRLIVHVEAHGDAPPEGEPVAIGGEP